MNETAKHKNISVALGAAQMEMGPMVKGADNPHFKSKYADLSDVVTVARPALNAHGIAFYHQVIAGAENSGSFMRTVLVHGESETHIECDVPLLASQANMQAFKSATTYAKRIGLESLTGLAPEDDDGNAASTAPAPMPKSSASLKREGSWEKIKNELENEMLDVRGIAGLEKVKAAYRVKATDLQWPASWISALKDVFAGYDAQFSAPELTNAELDKIAMDRELLQHPLNAG